MLQKYLQESVNYFKTKLQCTCSVWDMSKGLLKTCYPNSDSMFVANWACTLLRIELEEKRGNGCASNKTKNSYGCFFAPHVSLTSELWSRRNRIPRPCFDRCFLVCCFIPALPQLEIPESSREAYKTSNRILYRFFISGKGYRLVKFDPNTNRKEKHVWKHRSVIFLKANSNNHRSRDHEIKL